MAVTGLEAIADAVMHHEGWYPRSISNECRNPGNLRDSPMQCGLDPRGYAVFESLLDGYSGLLADLRSKVTGNNRHGLTPDSTLNDLFDVYAPRADKNDPNAYAEDVAHWCGLVLNKPCTVNSTLRYICAELFQGEST